MKKIAISACLMGKNTKYDGHDNFNKYVKEYAENYEYVLICPEIMGGLGVPRSPSEIRNDKVFNVEGIDVTKEFILGSDLEIQKIIDNGITEVIVKDCSPSCGFGKIYDGSFSHKKIDGNGLFIQRLLNCNNHIKIFTEKDIEMFYKK